MHATNGIPFGFPLPLTATATVNSIQSLKVLGDLYAESNGAAAVSIAHGYSGYSIDSSEQYHEAGWDSVVTGASFIQLAAALFPDPVLEAPPPAAGGGSLAPSCTAPTEQGDPAAATAAKLDGIAYWVRCAFFGRNSHPRPLVPTLFFKLEQPGDQRHSSRVFTCLLYTYRFTLYIASKR
jgi:hypothetical protein